MPVASAKLPSLGTFMPEWKLCVLVFYSLGPGMWSLVFGTSEEMCIFLCTVASQLQLATQLM